MTKKISYYLFIYIFSIIIYLILNIYNLKNNILENSQYFLKNISKSLIFLLTDDYLGKSNEPNTLNKSEYIYTNKKMSNYISETEIKRIYTLSYYNSDFFYTSYADQDNTITIDYFTRYNGNSTVFELLKDKKMRIIKGDKYITAFIPHIDKNSKFYIMVIEYSLVYADKVFYKNLSIFALSSLFLFIMTMTFIAFYRSTHKTISSVEKELKEIKKKKRELSKHKLIFEEKSKYDSLTRIRNREYIYEFYHDKCKEFNGTPFSVMLIDLDKFKFINDTFGHHLGDKVLIRATKEINKRVRDIDAFGRIGGDEFLLVFSNTDLNRAKELAEKITNDIRNLEFFYEEEIIKISCSIGLMQYGGQEPYDFLKIVDKYLYKAKENRDGFATI